MIVIQNKNYISCFYIIYFSTKNIIYWEMNNIKTLQIYTSSNKIGNNYSESRRTGGGSDGEPPIGTI